MAQDSATYDTLIIARVIQKFAQVNDDIQFMSDKSLNINVRRHYYERALSLFLAKGNPFEIDDKPCNGVLVETNNIYSKKQKRRRVKDYFTGILNLRYSLSSTFFNLDFCYVVLHELRKVDECKYVTLSSRRLEFLKCNKTQEHQCSAIDVYMVGWQDTIDGKEAAIVLGDIIPYSIQIE